MWNCQQTQDNKTDPNHIGLSIKYCNFEVAVIKWQLNFVSYNFGLKSTVHTCCALSSIAIMKRRRI